MTIVVVFLILLSTPSFFQHVDAGPLNSFAASPIPYWDDDSLDVEPNWEPNTQTVTLDHEWQGENGYYEDMSVVTDWQEFAGAPWEAGESISTDGDIMTFACEGDAANDFDGMHITAGISLTDTTVMIMRYKMSGLGADAHYVYLTAAGPYYTLPELTTWNTVYVYVGDWSAPPPNPTIDIILYGRNDNGIDTDLLVDYIYFGPNTGELDLNIPIKEQDEQEVSLYINSTELDSEVRLELYADSTATGTYCTVNDTHVTFPSSGLIGTSAQTDGWSRITFNNYQEIASAEIVVSDSVNEIQDYWTDYYTFTGANWLKLSDSAFNGSIQLLYINGDTNYTTHHGAPEWTESGTTDSDVMHSIFGTECPGDASDIDFDVTYSITLPYMTFIRTEWVNTQWDGAINDIDIASQELQVLFYYENGSIQFDVYFQLQQFANGTGPFINNTWYVKEYISGSPVDRVLARDIRALTGDEETLAQSMIWRTQENNLGVMAWDSRASWSVWGDNETTWISTSLIDNFKETDVSLTYELTEAGLSFRHKHEFQYFEYDYWQVLGVVQPHFSTTWWEGGRVWRIGPEFDGQNGGILATWDSWDEIPVPETEPPPEPVPWWVQLLKFFAAFGEIMAGGITMVTNIAWTGMVTAVTGAMNILAAAWEAAINFLWAGAGTALVGVFSGIVNTIGGLGSLIVQFFVFLGSLMTIIAAGVAWAQTYLFTPQAAQLILMALVMMPLLAYNGANMFGKGTGQEGAINWLYAYATVGLAILGLGWRLIMGIINTVANFIPLT